MHIKSLHIYPVKSARGIGLQTAQVKARGLAGDRRFMLVNADGVFITQREHPKLALLCTRQIDGGIALKWPEHSWMDVPHPSPYPSQDNRKQVTVWRSSVNATHTQDEINAALSTWLERPVSLVFMDESAERLANPKWTAAPSQVSFADGYPILITNTASLTALNNHITNTGGEALSMDRFRPNIVIDCDIPWAEDTWRSLQMGDVILDLVKPCARCVITSIDQSTGARHKKTALTALKNLHPSTDPKNPGVLFGWNAVVKNGGLIRLGEDIRPVFN
ncbi:MOSC domain-containing protein [bacterium AH-315-J23]|nr:MOSC domain-containing protein [bacterium AH-315-J23]